MNKEKIEKYGDLLYECLKNRSTMAPITDEEPDMTIEDAYHISLQLLKRRQEDGEKVIGKKIGVTSKAVQNMLNVHQPDFGFLTDRMVYQNGADIPVSELMIQPKAEGEIALRAWGSR